MAILASEVTAAAIMVVVRAGIQIMTAMTMIGMIAVSWTRPVTKYAPGSAMRMRSFVDCAMVMRAKAPRTILGPIAELRKT